MQGCMVRSWAPLGLLLVCLHLPGLFSRSINVVEEKVPQHSETNLPLPAQPPSTSPSNSEHPLTQPDPASKDFTSAPLMRRAPPSNDFQPAEGPETQGWPVSEGMPFVDSWSSEDPWPMMMAADEDYAEEALPEELSFLSGAAAFPQGSGPSSEGPSAPTTGASPDTAPHPLDSESSHPPRSNVLGPLEPTFSQSPFWSFINKIRQSFLSGRPCGILNPRVPVRGGGPGTGWGTRPMPNPVGIGGINNQYPSTGWGNVNKVPGSSWGNINNIPGSSWGNINNIPGSSWGNINNIPGSGWGNVNRIPGAVWGNIHRLPGGIWGNIHRLPGGIWGNIHRLPGGIWGNNQFPGTIWGPLQPVINKLPPGVLRPPSSSLKIPVGLPQSKGPASQ